MTVRPLPVALVLILVAAAVAATGCGNKMDTVTLGETEGIYVDVGPLTYQVQNSRVLNASDVEDKAYLDGLPPGTPEPKPDETWFAVFMRVQNDTDEEQPVATDFEIVDTLENTYRPVAIDEQENPFAYDPAPLPPDGVEPVSSSAAAAGPVQGGLLLFKLPLTALANRPLELIIAQAGVEPPEAIIDLDV